VRVGSAPRASAQDRHQVHRRLDQDFRPVRDEFPGRPEPPQRPYAVHPRPRCGLHVGVRVAEVGDVRGREAEDPRDFECARRVGLDRHAVAGSEDRPETPAGEVVLHDGERRIVRLVGEDGRGDVPRGQGVEEIGDAGIGPGLQSAPVAILHHHQLPQARPLPRVVGRGRGERPPDEGLQPVADELLALGDGPSRMAHADQGGVHGIGQVLDRIEERPVEVEDHGAVGHGLLRSALYPNGKGSQPAADNPH